MHITTTAVGKLSYAVYLRLMGVVGVKEVQGECLLDLGYRLRMYCGRVVPDPVLGGAVVFLARRFRGFGRSLGLCAVGGEVA